ncbi:MAG: ABC transporter substrate-binding protein [Tissierellia bacterium]|nr:ABC transporter substrate-binding protein [Tissierellia bacterium]
MKKLMALLLASTVLITGCTTKAANPSGSGETLYKIGIVQLAEHPALDDARRGFEDGLKELGVNVEIDYKNAQGDIPTTMTISQKFANDKVDLIYAIATSAAQSAKQTAGDIPLLFSAVTDPVKAGLVHAWDNVGTNVTGTSDLVEETAKQLRMFQVMDPSIKKIGIIYNTNEINSEIQIEEVERVAPEVGLEVITVGVSNINDLPQALESLIKKVDALYNISDNMVANSVELVANKLLENNMLSISAEESQVTGGILITNGLSYYELGKQTAKMAQDILVDGVDIKTIPVGLAEKTSTTVNIETLRALGLDESLPLFKDAIKVGE